MMNLALATPVKRECVGCMIQIRGRGERGGECAGKTFEGIGHEQCHIKGGRGQEVGAVGQYRGLTES